jgi:hypothetical protein
VLYPSTADWNSSYLALLNTSLSLVQVSLPNSPFSLKPACLNMFLSWILPYQDLHMIALPGLIISILFLCRITYSILAHFYLVYLSYKSPTLISFKLCLHSSTSYLHRYSSYCGSVTMISLLVFFIMW